MIDYVLINPGRGFEVLYRTNLQLNYKEVLPWLGKYRCSRSTYNTTLAVL